MNYEDASEDEKRQFVEALKKQPGYREYEVVFEKKIFKEGFERHRIRVDGELWYGKLTFETQEDAIKFFNENPIQEFE